MERIEHCRNIQFKITIISDIVNEDIKYKVTFEKQKLHESLVRKETYFIIQFRFIYRFVWRKNL